MSYFVKKLFGCLDVAPLDVEVGDLIASKIDNIYRIDGERFIRTGMFGAGYREFFVVWLNASTDRRSTGWVSEFTIDSNNHRKILS